MTSISLIAQEMNKVIDKMFELEDELKETRKKFNALQKQLEHWVKYNQTIKLK